MQEKLLIKFYSVGVSLLLKTSPWWLKVQSEGKTITFNLLILKLITDTQKKCVMTSASPSVKWTYLLMPFVKSALYLLYCLWGLTFWFLYFCLLLEKFISQFCWIEGCHFFRKEHEWMLGSVYEKWQQFSGCWHVNMGVQKRSSSLKFDCLIRDSIRKVNLRGFKQVV